MPTPEQAALISPQFRILRVTNDTGATTLLPYVMFPASDCAVPVVSQKQFESARNCFVVDSFVSVPFAAPEKPGLVEWYEGRIWATDTRPPGATVDSPWQSLRVLWYEKRAHDGSWMIALVQEDSRISPWCVICRSCPMH